ncbi:MAG: type IV toxin-antitoxin system AbiEi family antitoxin domain-containing protein [Thermoanaerobaculia bacterium]
MPRTPRTNRDRILVLLEERGLLRPKELSDLGIPRSALQRLVEEGAVERIARGLYALIGRQLSEYESLLEVSKQVPGGVICLLSALAFHRVGTQIPHQVWLAIGSKARRPVVTQVPIRIVRFSQAALEHGVEHHQIKGVELRVTSPARTVADCFKYRTKVGLDVAIEALREGWRDRRFRLPELREAAHFCRVDNIIRPYVETLL